MKIAMKSALTFKEKVYEITRQISKGKTMTYSEVARRAGSPKAARAVGNILAKNLDPKIPCHRVLRNDDGLGGYNRGGPAAKLRLLKKEGAL